MLFEKKKKYIYITSQSIITTVVDNSVFFLDKNSIKID